MAQPQKIQILAPDIANKIAAGEVVERPASIVKELVENAIDAGATEITIVLNKGGTELVQIVDNGAGIASDELPLAFQRHATSKIRTADDLGAIASLGFRGEALASIASVSRVEIKSVPQGESVGRHLQLDGGHIADDRPTGGPAGTSIAVKTLFFNTPARRKFLKADSTEYRHCLTTANRFALSYPDIHFILVHNGEVIWDVHPQSPKERVCAILGKRLHNLLVEVDDDAGAVQIHGFVGTQDTVRRHSGEQFLYLNGRFINDRSLNHAIVSGYGEILAHGGYPLYVLQLHIDPARVDVNVHPTKMQVKFADDRLIYAMLRGAVKNSLRSADVIPEFSTSARGLPRHPAGTWQSDFPLLGKKLEGFDPATEGKRRLQRDDFFTAPSHKTGADQLHFQPRPAAQEEEDWLAARPETTEQPETPAETGQSFVNPAQLWQLHNKYLVSAVNSGLIVIDQHAAHERILYERALKLFEKSKPTPQKLLFPVMIELSADDYNALEEMLPFLAQIGFTIADFGPQTVVIEAVPSGLKIKNHERVLQEMIDDFKRGKRANLEVRDNVAKIFACHSSIRTGDALSTQEMHALLEQLFAAETPYFCPHGRPIFTKISLDELDRRFGRT